MTSGAVFPHSDMAVPDDSPLQVGAICIDPDTYQVLLITSRGTGRWIIPKGWTMKNLTNGEAALQEAWEEAGVKGTISSKPIGLYHYDKMQDDGAPVPIAVQVYIAQVRKLAKRFPERKQRRRKWFAPDQAAELVAEPELQSILRRLTTHPDIQP